MLQGSRLALQRVDALADFTAFEALLRESGPWLGALDFPFGLPRELIGTLGWPRWGPTPGARVTIAWSCAAIASEGSCGAEMPGVARGAFAPTP